MKAKTRIFGLLMIAISILIAMMSNVMAENPLSNAETFGIPWWGIILAIGVLFLIFVFIPQLGPKLKMGFGSVFVLCLLVGLVMSPYTSLIESPEVVTTDNYTLTITPSGYLDTDNATYDDSTNAFTIAFNGSASPEGIVQTLSFNCTVKPPAGKLYDSEQTATIPCSASVGTFTSGGAEYEMVAENNDDQLNVEWNDCSNTGYETFDAVCGMGSTIHLWCNITLHEEIDQIDQYKTEGFSVSVGGQKYTVTLMNVSI